MTLLIAAGLAVLAASAPADPPVAPPRHPLAAPGADGPRGDPSTEPPPIVEPSEPIEPPPDPAAGPFVDATSAPAADTPGEAAPPIDPAALADEYRPYLAEALMRDIVLVLGSGVLVPENFEPMLDLARVATELVPDDPEVWRFALSVARLCASGVPSAVDFERTCIAKLVELDPHDDVARLLRLLQAVESFETAEERLAAFNTLLAPESRAKLGRVLASRLVFERALLQSRMGDIDGFAQSLAEAVSLDPAFPAATELAAGFFASRVDDIGEAAELLVATVVANPRRLPSYLDLGSALLAAGAYESAARIFELAKVVAVGVSRDSMNTIICDLATAQWGAGDPNAALTTIREFIREIDDEHLRALMRTYPDRVTRELEEQKIPLPIHTAILYAALSRAADSPETPEAISRLTQSFSATIEWLAAQGEQASVALAGLLLDGAWTQLLLGGEVDGVSAMVERAATVRPMTDEARERFAGWQLYRAGDLDGAIRTLEPVAPKDNMARLGLALALIARGDTRDGARELLAVANAERGTALGLVAADGLEKLVGVRPGPGPSAAALEAAVAQLPKGFDRFIRDASSALGLTIEPEKRTVAPFEPVRFRVTLTNLSPLPLAIDPQGPIEARAACSVSMTSVGYDPGDLTPLMIPIDRRLQLAPRESLTFTYDASISALGVVTMTRPFAGAQLTARSVVNFRPMQPRVLVGFMGREALSTPVRVDGVRVDEDWVRTTWSKLMDPERLPDPKLFVLFCHYLGAQEDPNDRLRMLALQRHWQGLAQVWMRYPPLVQTWIVLNAPQGLEADGPFTEAIRESNDPMVLTSFLLRRVSSPTDAALDVARRSIEPRLARLADGVQRLLERRIDDRRRSLGVQP